jgi:hypothetical protein
MQIRSASDGITTPLCRALGIVSPLLLLEPSALLQGNGDVRKRKEKKDDDRGSARGRVVATQNSKLRFDRYYLT